MDKHIYLRNIQDTNETRNWLNHISEMMPIHYTPTVGAACMRTSQIFTVVAVAYLFHTGAAMLDDPLDNATNHNVKGLHRGYGR